MQSYLTLCCSDQCYHYPTSQRRTLGCEDVSTLTKVTGRWVAVLGPKSQSLASDSNARATFLTTVCGAFMGVTFLNTDRNQLSCVLLSPLPDEETEAQK